MPSSESAREIASRMHSDSVDLWNRLHQEAGGSMNFVDRDDIETVQRILAGIAWPSLDSLAEVLS